MSGDKYFTLALPRRTLFLAAAVCGAIAVALGVAELGVRALAAAGAVADAPHLKIDGTDFFTLTYDPTLGWKNTPGRYLATFRDHQIEIRQDSHGFRNNEISGKKPAGVFRVLILGDSMAWGWGVDQRFVYSEFLEQKLNERGAGRKKFEVVNAAVSGYGTAQELLLFRRVAAAAQPDLVLLHYFGNDVGDNCRMSDYGAWRPVMVPFGDQWLIKDTPCPLRLPKPAEPARLLRPRCGLVHSALYRVLLSRSLGHFGLARLFGWLGLWSIEPNTSIQLDVFTCTPVTAGLITQLSKEARAAGAKFAVVLDPDHVTLDDRPSEPPNDFLTERLGGVAWLDLYSEFVRRDLREKDLCIPDSAGHYSPAGHQVVAEIVGDYLIAQKMVE